jgi:DNA-binding transcriptional LysR family regulator
VFGRKFMLPLLAQLLQQHPGLALDVRSSDARADLVKDGIDVAIRIGDMQDSTRVARRFSSQQLVLVAAPAYLQRQGEPQAMQDLATHRAIVFRLPGSGRDRPQQFGVKGRLVELQPAQGLRFNDGEAMVQAALLGLGLAQVPDNMVDEALATGRLVELLPQHRPPPMPIHAVMPAHRMVPARVRVLLDALDEWQARPPETAAAGGASVSRPTRRKAPAR